MVEFTTAVQGPAAGQYLRDMGAEVIKIEGPSGDGNRHGRGTQNELPRLGLSCHVSVYFRRRRGHYHPRVIEVGRLKATLDELGFCRSDFRHHLWGDDNYIRAGVRQRGQLGGGDGSPTDDKYPSPGQLQECREERGRTHGRCPRAGSGAAERKTGSDG